MTDEKSVEDFASEFNTGLEAIYSLEKSAIDRSTAELYAASRHHLVSWRQKTLAAYETAGSPYGNSENGAYRWWEEFCEIKRCSQRIRELKDRHALHVALRREGLSDDA